MKTALVLSGGGARGAYEVGVLRYLREGLPRYAALAPGRLRFDIVCGTSVGAINACYVAASANAPDAQLAGLVDRWLALRLEDVFRWSALQLAGVPAYVWRELRELKTRHLSWRLSDFLYPEALAQMVREGVDWSRISQNIRAGHLDALTVTATDLGSGRSVVFVESRLPLPAWSRDPNVEPRARAIRPEHALASAAIPLLFRPVRIEGSFYSDGSVRQNTPLSPALRLGAERVLVIGLRYHGPHKEPAPLPAGADAPGTATQLGKIMNALLLDHTDYDLDRLHRFNALMDEGELAFGPTFAPRLNAVVAELRGAPYKRVRDLVIRPSVNIADIARRHAGERVHGMLRPGTLAARLLKRAASDGGADGASDLASYLLFDRPYVEELMQLGWADAEARRDDLAAFFGA